MHEVSIAQSILDAVRHEAEPHLPARPVKVGLRIGEFAGIDPDSLSFCFQAMVKDTDLDPLELVVEPGAKAELEFAWLELEEP